MACLLAGACAGGGLIGNAFRPAFYTVRPGDTLYAIAWRYDLDYHELMRWNGIDDPRNVHPGRRLRLHPDRGGTSVVTTTRSSTDTASGGSSATRASKQKKREPKREPMEKPPGDWRWPVDGPVIGTFDNGVVAGKGIDIGGKAGQPVRSTAAGEVVYSGDGLKAYGKLLIIRHKGDHLSAYAHNRELLVHEEDQVRAGQPIARMGKTREGRALLHFEIRRGGDPVDPMRYLPAR